MKTPHILPIFLLIIISCSSIDSETTTVSAKKHSVYLISNDSQQLHFNVYEIDYKIDGDSSEESIEYTLNKTTSSLWEPKTSSVKHRRIKQKDNSILLEKIEGSQTLTEEGISFTWSYGNDNLIYLYLPTDCKIKELE